MFSQNVRDWQKLSVVCYLRGTGTRSDCSSFLLYSVDQIAAICQPASAVSLLSNEDNHISAIWISYSPSLLGNFSYFCICTYCVHTFHLICRFLLFIMVCLTFCLSVSQSWEIPLVYLSRWVETEVAECKICDAPAYIKSNK